MFSKTNNCALLHVLQNENFEFHNIFMLCLGQGWVRDTKIFYLLL